MTEKNKHEWIAHFKSFLSNREKVLEFSVTIFYQFSNQKYEYGHTFNVQNLYMDPKIKTRKFEKSILEQNALNLENEKIICDCNFFLFSEN